MSTPVIDVRGVGKEFSGAAGRVLSDVDLTVHAGDLVAITGPSGSGKSTLLNILGLLDTPSEGRYRLLGQDVSQASDRERTALRALRIGFVFQSFHLIAHLDLVDNVALPLLHARVPTRERRSRARQALTDVGLGRLTRTRPGTLSGGEMQRAAIARATVHAPAVVLCDEPTGNLDTANTGRVLELLAAIVSAERTVIVVTHDPLVAARASRQITVLDGRVA